MIAAGRICKRCGAAGRCVDPPSDNEPLEVQCPACDGAGCDGCIGGWIKLTGCPQRFVDHSTVRFVQMAELFRRGRPIAAPVLLDESASFFNACCFWQQERNRNAPSLDELIDS